MTRGCEWSRKFLKKVYFGENYYTQNPKSKFHEQSSMRLILENNHPNENVLIREPTLHKTWPIKFPDKRDFLVHHDSPEVNKFWRRKKHCLFHKGDFMAHCIGHETRSVQGRKRDYEVLSNHVLWHE
jgi:hypothetical protein